jgi:hypothetical protein
MKTTKTASKTSAIGALFATLVLSAGLAAAQNQPPNQPAQRDKVQPDQVAGSTGGLSNTGSKTNPDASTPGNGTKKSKSKKMSSASATGDGTPTTNTKSGDNADTTAPDTGSKGSLVTNRVPPAK